MTDIDSSQFSLADFHINDSDDPLRAPQDFSDWRASAAWGFALFEPCLLDGPRPQTRLDSSDGKKVINMTSYNYLGMVNDSRVIEAAKQALDRYGAGACGSPILSGMTDLHRDLETRLATFLGREGCMLFSSGFGGGLGILAGLLRRGDFAFLDEKCHISLMEGVKLSGARLETFRHNDSDHLDQLLGKTDGERRMVVLEGIYSMDGDYGDLPGIAETAKKHSVGVVIDEAHSILTSGANGRGAVEHFGCSEAVTLQYGTFSKAFAGVGGFVVGPKALLEYMRYFATVYGFSCALPPSVVAGLLAVLDIVEKDHSPRECLMKNAQYFRSELNRMGIDTGESVTQVVPIIIGSQRKLLYELGVTLRQEGLFLAPVDFPSVPQDSVRFRASVTAAHSKEDLDRALEIIQRVIVPRIERKAT